MEIIAKPFIKWAGGKRQLITQIENKFSNLEKLTDITYIEPFIGGGAMLFYLLQKYPNIKNAIINDINSDLINCYKVIKNNVEDLIIVLYELQNKYYDLESFDAKQQMYLAIRQQYNEKTCNNIKNVAYLIFLNHTCFNGLYRVNKKGLFNVPCGKYINPKICNEELLRIDSKLLQKVKILNGDFENTFDYATKNTIFYIDPPYRPLNATSNFNNYVKETFNDDSQIRLKNFCDKIHNAGYNFVLSNSDCQDKFFDNLYYNYNIDRILAARNINSNGNKRGKISELIIYN